MKDRAHHQMRMYSAFLIKSVFLELRSLRSILLILSLFYLTPSCFAEIPVHDCPSLFVAPIEQTTQNKLPASLLSLGHFSTEIAKRRSRVHEFEFIRKEAQIKGLRVWLFGGTAAAFGHYVKWDLLRESGQDQFQADRFDYDYTNIYRSTQDLDIVVDGSALEALAFEKSLKKQFPYFLGSKATGWEVRSLRDARADKGGLLDDFGFMNQHTDSNSTGMVELTDPPIGESVIRDLRDWHKKMHSKFLVDLHEGRITFYPSLLHSQTPRAKAGLNPPIFSVIRALTKAFQYGLQMTDSDLELIQREIDRFDPKVDLKQPEAAQWVQKNAKKLFYHAVDVEYAWNILEKLGLRKKLIRIQDDERTQQSLAWWLNKEPLRSFPVGKGTGRTAESLGILLVSHETNDYLAFENITRSHTGAPNVFISRHHFSGETATHGDGFYTTYGRRGGRGTGITIRFQVDPNAREGHDFILSLSDQSSSRKLKEGDIIVWKNKNAIRIIPESLQLTPTEYFEFLAKENGIEAENQSLLWKFKRKLDHRILSGRIPQEEIEGIRKVVLRELKDRSKNHSLLTLEWLTIEVARLNKSPTEAIHLAELIQTKADPASLIGGIREIYKSTDLELYFEKQWLPSVLNEFKLDLGDRVLESCLLSNDSLIAEIGALSLQLRNKNHQSDFTRALEKILDHNKNPVQWIQSEETSEQEIKQKTAYIALHPELRNLIPPQSRVLIQNAFREISNLELFEKITGTPLHQNLRYESFQFRSFNFPPEE